MVGLPELWKKVLGYVLIVSVEYTMTDRHCHSTGCAMHGVMQQ